MMAGIHWRPGIGDPTWIGWTTVVAYLIAAWLCVRAGWRTRNNPQRPAEKTTAIWFTFAASLFFLGANKQLDLQTAFIELGSHLARGEGWYQQRRPAQIIFVLVLGLAIATAVFVAVSKQRHFFKSHALTLLGSIFLAAFVFLRAAIFNHVDDDAGFGLGEGQWLDSLELAGILCFIAASLRAETISTRKK